MTIETSVHEISEQINDSNLDNNIELIKNRIDLVKTTLKNNGYFVKSNRFGFEIPYYVCFKIIEKSNFVLIDLIIIRILKSLNNINQTIIEDFYYKINKFKQKIINTGLKINPINSKNKKFHIF